MADLGLDPYLSFVYKLITGCRIAIQGFFTTPGEYMWHA